MPDKILTPKEKLDLRRARCYSYTGYGYCNNGHLFVNYRPPLWPEDNPDEVREATCCNTKYTWKWAYSDEDGYTQTHGYEKVDAPISFNP